MHELDDQLINVIAKALSYDTENRFQSADEFIKAIDGEVKLNVNQRSAKFSHNRTQIMYLVLQK